MFAKTHFVPTRDERPEDIGTRPNPNHRKNRVGNQEGRWQAALMGDYERIAEVIRFLDRHQEEQPGLAELAEQVGLSSFHFHRLFSRWAGVTPKDFLQCLTFAHVKARLANGESVLETALNAGLSGPGRVHDLCVALESATPGEMKSGGEGWLIEAGYADSPFGTCLVAASARGICHLSFVELGKEPAAWARLQSDWPRAGLQRDDVVAARIANTVFEKRMTRRFNPLLRAFVKGTPFQVRVWRALLNIPPGHLLSYKRVAASIGNPAASRAVGTAVGQNPLAYLIPCHRVIRETGVVGEYRWGRTRKCIMMAWEHALCQQRGKEQALR